MNNPEKNFVFISHLQRDGIPFTIKHLYLEINKINRRYFLILYFNKKSIRRLIRPKSIFPDYEIKHVLATFGGSCRGELRNFALKYPFKYFEKLKKKSKSIKVNKYNIKYLINIFYILKNISEYCCNCNSFVKFNRNYCEKCQIYNYGFQKPENIYDLKYFRNVYYDIDESFRYYILYGKYSFYRINGISSKSFANFFFNLMSGDPFKNKEKKNTIIKRLQVIKYLFDINSKYMLKNEEIIRLDYLLELFRNVNQNYEKYIHKFMLDDYCFTKLETTDHKTFNKKRNLLAFIINSAERFNVTDFYDPRTITYREEEDMFEENDPRREISADTVTSDTPSMNMLELSDSEDDGASEDEDSESEYESCESGDEYEWDNL